MSVRAWLYISFLIIPLVYILLSFILLRKPHYLHKRRRPAFIARNIGHRGGAGECIENSLLAFDIGLKNGLNMIELDCHLTKDGHVVVHHDSSIDRTTGEHIFIRNVEYEKLPGLRNQIELYYDEDIMVSCDDNSVNDELLRIPLLKDVFERYPGVPINLDVKTNNNELIRRISHLIAEYERENLTYWGSFNHATCQALTSENPHIVRFCSLKEVAGIVLAYWLGLLPFLPLTPGAFEVPLPGETLRKATRHLNWKFKLLFRIIEYTLCRKSMFVHLQRRGIPVYVWTLNNEQEFYNAFHRLGVTGIMTDYPSRLHEYLLSHKNEYVLN